MTGQPIICERCGQKILTSKLGRHRGSARHRYGPTISQMLADPQYSLADIARVCKVTREQIRLIAKDMGYGRERVENRKAWTAARLIGEVRDRFNRVLPLDVQKRFTLTTIPCADQQGARVGLLDVNGHRCAIRHAWYPPGLAKEGKTTWLRVRKPSLKGVEFVLYLLPTKFPAAKGWLVIPAAILPDYTTYINLAERSSNPHFKGRWRQYLNAWDLLEKKEQGAV